MSLGRTRDPVGRAPSFEVIVPVLARHDGEACPASVSLEPTDGATAESIAEAIWLLEDQGFAAVLTMDEDGPSP